MASQVPPPIEGAPTQAEGLSRPEAPMSDYNVKALTALRAELKTKIVMGTHLNDMLEKEAEGFMTRQEAQSVRSDDKSQMGLLIDILLGKGDEEFRIFCEMLRKSNHLGWAETLKQEAESFKSKVLKVLPRKQSRSSASSGETPSSSAEKRTQDEYKKMEQDLEKQDLWSMRERCCPDRAIRLLYANAHKRLVQLLKPHLDAVKDAADTYIQLGLHEAEGEKPCDIQSVQSMSELINQMSTRSTWDSTSFLQQAVDAIPAMAIEREVAEAILAHYNYHLDIYNRAKLLKDHLSTKRSESDNEGKEIIELEKLVPVKITSSKPYDDFTCEDCYHVQARILSQAFSIPKEQIICYDALPCQSTTVIFLVPNGFIYVIMQHTTRLETVWTLLELDVIEVAISGFTFKPTVGCFLALLRGSKPFTANLLGVTEILPFQMHCLIDPGSKEPLSGQLLGNKRIAQHWRSHEEFMSDTATDEGVEATTEISDERSPAKMEETNEAEGMRAEREAGGSDELQSRIQELVGHLEESESKRLDLEHDNMALRNKLKVVHEEKAYLQEDAARLKKKLLSVECSQGVVSQTGSLEKEMAQQELWMSKLSAPSSEEEEMELKQRMRKMDLSSDTLDLPVFQRGHESVTNSGPEHISQNSMVSQGAPATSDHESDFGVPGMPEARGIHSGPPSELEHRTSLHLRNQAAELKGIKRYIDDWLTTKEDELAQLERLSETQTTLTNSEELLQQLEDYSYTIQTMNKLDISRELPTGETESLTTEADPVFQFGRHPTVQETAGRTRRYEELKTRVSQFHSMQRLLVAEQKLTDEIRNLVGLTEQFHSQRHAGSKHMRDAANEMDAIFQVLLPTLIAMGVTAAVAGGVGYVASALGFVTGGAGFVVGAAGAAVAGAIGVGGVTAGLMFMRKKMRDGAALTDANNWVVNEDRPRCEQLLEFMDSYETHWQEVLDIFPDRMAMVTHFRQHGIDLEKLEKCLEELSEVGRRWREFGFGSHSEADIRKAEEVVRTYLQEDEYDEGYLRLVTMFLDLEKIGAIGYDVTYLKRKKPPIRELLMIIANGLENDALPAKRVAEQPWVIPRSL